MVSLQRARTVGRLEDEEHGRELPVTPVRAQEVEAASRLDVGRQDRRVGRTKLDAQERQPQADQQREQRHQDKDGSSHHEARQTRPEAVFGVCAADSAETNAGGSTIR